jgi:hypothetical protein
MANDDLLKLPAVATNVLLDCKKCGSERYHKVLFHSTPSSAKVECEVCKSKKTYKVTKPKAGGKKATKRKKSVVTDASMWKSLEEEIGTKDAAPYNMREAFEPSTAIEHKKFGVGFVTAATTNRIEVQFQDSHRTLVHNHGN